ncbi:MAG: hypothetical protein KAT52_04215 [Desulfobacterales bacterium]|nr:hypothetical protein [Desulfobacterales bacterium]
MSNNLFGSFSISSWGVYEYFSEQEYRDAINMVCDPVPDRMGSIRKAQPLDLTPEVLHRNCEIIRTREHEWTHFRQHISTELGLFIHRAVAVQEWAATEYFKHLNISNSKYHKVPFLVRFHSLAGRKNTLTQTEQMELSILNIWQMSDIIQGALWCKKIRVRDLIFVWNSMVNSLSHLHKGFLLNNPAGSKLCTKRSLDDESCPDGGIPIQILAEGFAKYKEFLTLASLYGAEVALEAVLLSLDGIYRIAGDYIMEYLGVPFFHPLSGALIEVALLCFRDPFLRPDSEVLYWEDIHPGLRFQEAVIQLTSKLSSIPKNPEDCYTVALEAFGLGVDQSFIYEWLDISHLECTPTSNCKLEKGQSPFKMLNTGYEFLKTIFTRAHQFRRDYPVIYFEHSIVPFEVQQEFAAITRPPFIVGPSSIEICRGAERDVSIGLLCLKAALNTAILNELAREATLRQCAELADKSLSFYPHTLDRSMWSNLRSDIELVCGQCIQPYMNELLKK